MGALFHVQVHYVNLADAVQEALENGFRTMCSCLEGESIHSVSPSRRQLVIIGSESHGVSEVLIDMSDTCITIPNVETDRKVESLNASVATALILSELSRSRH